MKRVGIHIFRRDLRLEDNTALNALAKEVDEIIPVFIFDDRQIKKHSYRSVPGLQMLCESLTDLNESLTAKNAELHVCEGLAEKVVEELIKNFSPLAISYNKDYTPFAVTRDEAISVVCQKHNVQLLVCDDATLHAPGSIVNKEGKPYSVYTHYRLAVEALPVPQPARLPARASFVKVKGGESLETTVKKLISIPQSLRVAGGRSAAKKLLLKLSHNKNYTEERDFPSVHATSLLSAHIKFGTLSIREIYHHVRLHMPQPTVFLRELLWHDFFTTVAALSPHVYTGAFRPEFNKIKWSTDEDAFARWKEGKTGFPIVDAGMRELAETGYMHNRVRMIVASFLIKDLHINWQWGEKYFAQMLTDYDPAVNNGNWQWVAGTGCDASPWFRVFNPWLQQEKFDAECLYIKKWVPELADLDAKDIHDEGGSARVASGYPLPMCDHRTEAALTKEHFSVVKK